MSRLRPLACAVAVWLVCFACGGADIAGHIVALKLQEALGGSC